jgi:hypothetical protein
MKLGWWVVLLPLLSVIAITVAVREHASKTVPPPTSGAAAQTAK